MSQFATTRNPDRLRLNSRSFMSTKTEATVEDLYQAPGKAEIVNGEIVHMSPTGDLPGSAAGEVFASLRDYSRRAGLGRAYADNVGFVVNLPHRKSFSPDACFYVGPRTRGKFLTGAPIFAVEVRSEDDCGREAEKAMARKRADYFAAGTLVVWDADVLRKEEVHKYIAGDPEHPVVFCRGDVADAEPAVPGWTMPVDDLFG